MVKEITGKLILDSRVGIWCQCPYPNHPYGCPNYGKRPYCPPNVSHISKFIDLNKPHWFIINKFNLQEHIEKMRIKHPSWSERRLRCVLYWQTHVRRMLRNEIKSFQQTHPDTKFTLLPEAMGINVIVTALKNGIDLEVKPKKIVTKIALIGYPSSKIGIPKAIKYPATQAGAEDRAKTENIPIAEASWLNAKDALYQLHIQDCHSH